MGRCFCFVIGGPGSGKGTQCEGVVATFPGWKHISVGQLLRREAARDSPQGRMCAEHMNRGQVVPLDIVMGLLKEAMANVEESKFLIDGFPRDASQIGAFEEQFGDFAGALFYECSEDVLLQRLRERSLTSGREDDSDAIIQQRLHTFSHVTLPVRSQLADLQKLHLIDASGTVDEIFNATSLYIRQLEHAID